MTLPGNGRALRQYFPKGCSARLLSSQQRLRKTARILFVIYDADFSLEIQAKAQKGYAKVVKTWADTNVSPRASRYGVAKYVLMLCIYLVI